MSRKAPVLAAVLAVAWVLLTPLGAFAAGTAVPLGAAGPFAVLAGQSVANTGPSVVNGALGVSPGASISGFPPGTVNGAVHSADATALQAQNDLVTAYNDAAGQTPDANIALDLGGLTLTPRVYHASAAIAINGPLTLDAQGDPNAVFVFQLDSALTTSSAARVVLVNGAQAANVFWQVGASATLGSGSTFAGTIMAMTSVSVQSGVLIDGRALARNGTVMLDTVNVSCPGCGGGTTTGGTSGGTSGGSSGGTSGGGNGGGHPWHRPWHRPRGNPWAHRPHHHRPPVRHHDPRRIVPSGAPATGLGAPHGSGTGELAAGAGLLGLTALGTGACAARRRGTRHPRP